MLNNYPKTRSELPEKLEKIYLRHYKSNREGDTMASGIAQKMEKWLHKKVASDVNPSHEKKTLEIGAGTLNQLDYEVSTHYDIVEPFKELYINSPHLNKVRNVFYDIEELDEEEKYDRITSIATFEHILDLPKVIAEACLHLNTNGSLRTSIPNEGRLLWKIGWKLTTGLEFKLKYGFNYSVLMKHEHVNSADEIEDILNYFFKHNDCQLFGVSKEFAFYRFYESRGPIRARAKKYLQDYSKG